MNALSLIRGTKTGFSLLEIVTAFWLGTLLMLGLLRILMSVWMGSDRILQHLEAGAAWSQLQRVVATDVHGATGVAIVLGSLQVTEADGTVYRYVLNRASQVVRIQQGGGTAVVATAVQYMDVVLIGSMVRFTAQVTDGSVHTLFATALQGWGAS